MTKKKCNSHDLQEEVWLKKASSYYMQSCRQNDEERKKEKENSLYRPSKGGSLKKVQSTQIMEKCIAKLVAFNSNSILHTFRLNRETLWLKKKCLKRVQSLM